MSIVSLKLNEMLCFRKYEYSTIDISQRICLHKQLLDVARTPTIGRERRLSWRGNMCTASLQTITSGRNSSSPLYSYANSSSSWTGTHSSSVSTSAACSSFGRRKEKPNHHHVLYGSTWVRQRFRPHGSVCPL